MCSALTSNSLISSHGAPESPKRSFTPMAPVMNGTPNSSGTLGEDAAHAPGQRADLVLFGSDDRASLPRRPNDGFLINRFHGVHVDHARLVSEFLLQDPCRAHCFRHHGPASNNAEVFLLVFVVGCKYSLECVDHLGRSAAQPTDIRHSKHERRVFASDDGRGLASEADVLRTNMLQQQVVSGLAGLDGVAGYDNRHVRQPAHREQVFERLMGCAVGADRNLHRELRRSAH
jgi:hypothetical protein